MDVALTIGGPLHYALDPVAPVVVLLLVDVAALAIGGPLHCVLFPIETVTVLFLVAGAAGVGASI